MLVVTKRPVTTGYIFNSTANRTGGRAVRASAADTTGHGSIHSKVIPKTST